MSRLFLKKKRFVKDFFRSNVCTDVNSYAISLNEWSIVLFFALLNFRLIADRISDQRLECLKIMIKNRRTISIVWLILSDKSSIWKWYAAKYISFTFKRTNIAAHISDRNFRSRSKMIVFDRFQSARSSWLNNACFHCVANHVIFSDISKMRLKYLQLTDIMQFQSSTKKKSKWNQS